MDDTPWICHVCEAKGRGESRACSLCYKVACAKHLRTLSIYNKTTALYEFQPVCLACTVKEALEQ